MPRLNYTTYNQEKIIIYICNCCGSEHKSWVRAKNCEDLHPPSDWEKGEEE